MPDQLIFVLALLMVAALGLVSWAWYQAYLNHKHSNDRTLRRYAWIKLMRESILWVAQASLTSVYLLVIAFPQPRNESIQALIVILLLAMSAAVALLSLHDFREMREFFADKD